MQKVRYLLLVILLYSSWAHAAYDRPFYLQIYSSIMDYFTSSNRQVDDIDLGNPRHFEGDKYLIEANVTAQAAFGNHFLVYHCGVFFHKAPKKNPNDTGWVVEFVTCEARSSARARLQ